ncbi:CopG family transcriptional regulator, partial [Pseudomonas sp. GW460-13]
QQDLTASQVIRRLIRDYLAQHGVQYVPSGVDTDKAEAKGKERPPVGASSRRDAAPPAKRRATRRGA